jgi:hypothetical protein
LVVALLGACVVDTGSSMTEASSDALGGDPVAAHAGKADSVGGYKFDWGVRECSDYLRAHDDLVAYAEPSGFQWFSEYRRYIWGWVSAANHARHGAYDKLADSNPIAEPWLEPSDFERRLAERCRGDKSHEVWRAIDAELAALESPP